MKFSQKIIFSIVFLMFFAAKTFAQNSVLQNEKDSLSYAIGVNMAQSLQKSGLEVNQETLFAAMRDVFAGQNVKLDEQMCMGIIQTVMMRKRAEADAGQSEAAKENLEKGRAFLEKVKTEEGVIVHESGVLYKVLKAGTGEIVGMSDNLKVHYHGMLIDGSVFDSSVDRGQPFETSLSQVISGWHTLAGMKVGTKCKLYIPSELAYGTQQAGPEIGPNSTLIFEVEILEKVN